MSAGAFEPALPTERTPQGAELARRFWERLRVVATRRLGDAAGANDVARETLRRVAEAMRSGSLERPAALPALVFDTARAVCAERRRPEARETPAGTRSDAARAPHVRSAPAIETLGSLITDAQRRAVLQAFASLRDGDRKVLRLAYLERLNVDEIALRLGSTAGAVRVRKHRALRRLADHLSAQPRGHTAATGGR